MMPGRVSPHNSQLNWTALPAAMNRVETKYYHFAGQRIAMKRDGILTYLHSDHLGSAVLETNVSGQIVADQRYYAYGKQRDSGPVGTDHRFSGQKHDGSGLVYMNARYYDPVLGQFISPDTLVPDAGLLVDYNRYMYARGNPMRFSDPSGFYSNDEIMQHFGCSDWSCVEAMFADDGAYAGLWGWLYILQQAEDGDEVTAFNYSVVRTGGTVNSELTGIFARSSNGVISVAGRRWRVTTGPGAGESPVTAILSDAAIAHFAGNADVFGSYAIIGHGRTVATNATQKHNYLSIDPGQATIAGLKAGVDFGPLIIAAAPVAGPAAPIVAGVGIGYTVVGASVSLVVDVALPLSHYVQGDRTPLIESTAVEGASQGIRLLGGSAGRKIAPIIGPVYDLGKSLCYGTGCGR